MYYALNNSNGNLFQILKTFTTGFPSEKIAEINTDLKYLTVMALGVMALIMLSGFIVIPLFGKI